MLIFFTSLYLAQAIIVLWLASQGIRQTGVLWPFLPLIAFSIVFCGLASLFYYELLLTIWQSIYVLGLFLSQVWFLSVILSFIKKQI